MVLAAVTDPIENFVVDHWLWISMKLMALRMVAFQTER